MIQKLSNQAGKTQCTINAVTGCGEVYDKYTFVHVTCLQIKAWQLSLQMWARLACLQRQQAEGKFWWQSRQREERMGR